MDIKLVELITLYNQEMEKTMKMLMEEIQEDEEKDI